MQHRVRRTMFKIEGFEITTEVKRMITVTVLSGNQKPIEEGIPFQLVSSKGEVLKQRENRFRRCRHVRC